MVLAYKKKQQKNRSFVAFRYSKIKFGNSAIIALSSGFLYSKTIKNFYIMFKKFFNSFKSITKFWIYINVYYIITKKPLNVRMGKGKGSRKGRLALVKSGNSIVELKYCRFGLFFKLYRCISTRCSFNTNYIYNKNENLSKFNMNIVNYSTKCKNFKKIKNKNYIVDRMSEVLNIYSRTSDIKRYKKINTLFNSYFKLNNYYNIFLQKINSWHIINYLRYYLKKKKKNYLIYNYFFGYTNKFWKKSKRRKLKKTRLTYKKYKFFLKEVYSKVYFFKIYKLKIKLLFKKIKKLNLLKKFKKLKIKKKKYNILKKKINLKKKKLIKKVSNFIIKKRLIFDKLKTSPRKVKIKKKKIFIFKLNSIPFKKKNYLKKKIKKINFIKKNYAY